MAEHSIIFNDHDIRAILDGRKTQARRLISGFFVWTKRLDRKWPAYIKNGVTFPVKGYGDTGDRLWVKEPFSKCGCHACKSAWPNKAEHNVIYKANNQMADINFCSPIFMPRWASRITLEITNIRVERVQDITEEDARAEGVNDGGCLNCGNKEPCGCTSPNPNARDSFIFLWDSINEKRGYGWDSNPWVWKIEFRRLVMK